MRNLMGIFQKLLSVGKENSLLEQSTVSVQVSPIVIEKKAISFVESISWFT